MERLHKEHKINAKIKTVQGREITAYLYETHEYKPGDFIDVKKKRKTRTLDQNSLYWMLLHFSEKYLHMTSEEIHSGLKEAHQKRVKVTRTGDLFSYQASTTKLSREEFGVYMDKCNLTLAEFGVPVDIFWEQYEKQI